MKKKFLTRSRNKKTIIEEKVIVLDETENGSLLDGQTKEGYDSDETGRYVVTKEILEDVNKDFVKKDGSNLEEDDVKALRDTLKIIDTVDGVKPDKNKNVQLNALVKNKVNEVGEEFALKKGNVTLSFDEEQIVFNTDYADMYIGSDDGFAISCSFKDGSYFGANRKSIIGEADGYLWVVASQEGFSNLLLPITGEDREHESKTLAVSWNGVFADEYGNIDVDIVTPIIKDDNNNLITDYVQDNPNLFKISGKDNIILSTYTDNPINVKGNDNFLQGENHRMSNSYSSAAFGRKHTVDGSYSAAFGYNNTVRGSSSTAFGSGNTVYGSYSAAFGLSNTVVDVGLSTAFGYNNTVRGSSSTAFGDNNTVSGSHSTAFGLGNTVNESYSTAFGSYSKAHRVANGNEIINELRFSIGIGSDNNTRMNALSVFKNGEAWFDELTTAKIDNSKSNKVAITKEYLDLRVPKPPTSGNHVLKSIGGTVQWVAE